MFSELLKELRTRKKVTQIELARAIGVSNGNVGDWERGRSKPGYDALAALSRYFEISAGQLLELPCEGGDVECDGTSLSPKERDMIAMFRCLSDAAQKELYELVYFKYIRLTDGEKDSIYWTYAADELKAKSTAVSDGKAQGGIA